LTSLRIYCALYSAVLEVEVVGESRVPDVAEARRVSVVEEADVGELGDFVFVDSESVGKPFSATEVASVFLCDILLPILARPRGTSLKTILG